MIYINKALKALTSHFVTRNTESRAILKLGAKQLLLKIKTAIKCLKQDSNIADENISALHYTFACMPMNVSN
jgi:hypothetical protein